MNNKLLKLNNEYVKLYITSNESLPELLKNSGSLIVYHENKNTSIPIETGSQGATVPQGTTGTSTENLIEQINEIDLLTENNNSNTGTNYLYLGNEMLASGWGFNNENQKNAAINYLSELPKTVNTVINRLNDIINDINNNKKLYIGNESDLGSYEKLYISSKYFPSKILVDENNEKNILIKDLPQLLNKATYKEEEITSVEYSIVNIDGNNIEDNNNIIRDDINKCFYVPYNYDTLYLQVKIELNLNDAGSIDHIEFNGVKIEEKINNNDNDNNNDNYINDNYILSTINDNNTIDNQIITITKNFIEINEIIDPDIYIIFNKTNTYKNYPNSTYNSLKYLYSIENIIPEHTVRINNLFERYKIIPKNTIYENDIKLIKGYIDETFSYIGKLKDFVIPQISNFNKKLIIDKDNIIFEINNNTDNNTTNNELNPNLIMFIIPSKYNIENITLYSKDNIINKNILNNFKIIYNCLNYNNLLHNIIYTVIDLNNQQYYLKFKVSENNNLNTDNINLNNDNNINLLNSDIINKTWYLTNDNTDSFYWFNGPENNYMLNIIDKLLFNYSTQENNNNKETCKASYKERFYTISDENNTALDQVLSLL